MGNLAPAPPVEAPFTPDPPAQAAHLSEEEQIESAKYLPRELPPRLFEEERFVFPETYGVNRVRLLIKDPRWLFAHWDIDPGSLSSLRGELGERAAAVSRLTLRITDPDGGGSRVILLPEGARSCYVPADSARSCRAEVGFTLPSGEFRRLAESPTVHLPWVGPSPQKATRRIRYDVVDVAPASPTPVASHERPSPTGDAGPWRREVSTGAIGGAGDTPAATEAQGLPGSEERGGASDVYRR